MSTTLEQILTYYADRLIAQYRTMPRARATIEIFGKQVVMDNVAEAVGYAFSIETAVGPQLDILGKYIGVPRNVGDVAVNELTYFAFTDYAGATGYEVGFADYTDEFSNADGVFFLYGYAPGLPSLLNDDQYRLVLKLQIVANSSDGTLASLQDAMVNFLDGSFQVIDAQDMTIVYVAAAFPPISMTVLRRFLPRPMTMDLSVIVTSPSQRCLDDGSTLRTTDIGSIRALVAG
jgi:hypothetical protein